MQAIKLNAHVGRDRRVSVQLPEDMPEGEVEIIVLARGAAEADENTRRAYLETLLRRIAASDRPRRSKAEIDAYLAGERASWER